LGEPQGDITVYNNYVGEPLIEINADGGMIVTNKILEVLISNGARLAEPGEFSRRGFLNGKLDVSKADAIHNLIMSKTRLEARNEASKVKGSASKV
ncbi:tRNA uridine-5-carboxymethylaminomethyl(34) synthesis GTPase MnmE, partial [Mycoplasmopsis synoviae]